MALLEGKSPAERNKTIAAIALGAIAVLVLGYLFFGGSSTPPPRARANTNNSTGGSSGTNAGNPPRLPPPPVSSEIPRIIPADFPVPPEVDAQRNIFGYEAPKPSPTPNAAKEATPVPTPTPPMVLAQITPQGVYAGTGDFDLEVTGDKFAPGSQIYINESQVPTRFVSAQQVAAKVPAQIIASEGTLQLVVRTPDGKLYSNTGTLNVQAPPTPKFTYIGLLRTRQYVDTAILVDNGTRAQVSVSRGDIVGGRFRVTSISEREISLTDTTLKIKHSLPLTGDKQNRSSSFTNQQRIPEPPPDVDEEESNP